MKENKDGLMEILNGDGCQSDNKIVKYATYATSAVLIAAVGYAIYKGVKNSKQIENLQSQLAEIKGAQLTAPETETVTI